MPIPAGASLAGVSDGGVIGIDRITWELADLPPASPREVCAAAVRALSFATTAPAQPVRLADANGTASTYLSDASATFAPTDTVSRLAKLVADPHPRVRMEAVRALAKFPSAQSAGLVLSAVDGIGADPFLDYAVWLSINELAQPFLAALVWAGTIVVATWPLRAALCPRLGAAVSR